MDQEMMEKIALARTEYMHMNNTLSIVMNDVIRNAEEIKKLTDGNPKLKEDESHQRTYQKSLSELSRAIETCTSIRRSIETISTNQPMSRRDSDNESHVLQELNPSIPESLPPLLVTDHFNLDEEQTMRKTVYAGDNDETEGAWASPPDSDTVVDQKKTKKKLFLSTTGLVTDGVGSSPRDECPDSAPPPYSSPGINNEGFPYGEYHDDIFSVKLGKHGNLKKDERNTLDKVVKSFFPSSVLNRDTGVFHPTVEGLYAINVEMCQHGEGSMDVWLSQTGYVSYVGKTVGHMTETSTLKVKHIKKDQVMWVTVTLLKGESKVYWCNFSAFLIKRLPLVPSQGSTGVTLPHSS